MKLGMIGNRQVLMACMGGALFLLALKAPTAVADSNLPAVVESGFEAWAKGGAVDAILMSWERGGLLEGSNKASNQARYMRNLSSALGTYKSHELIQGKPISGTSKVLYIAINFQRGVVYARFLVYRAERDWVVQNMDFSERPEAIMPWLAFAGDQSQQ